MKTKYLLPVLFFTTSAASSQNALVLDSVKNFRKVALDGSYHTSYLVGINTFIWSPGQEGCGHLRIPYTSLNLTTGVKANCVFEKEFKYPHVPAMCYNFAEFDYSWHRHYLISSLGVIRSFNQDVSHGANISLGYGFNFFLRNPFHFQKSGWVNNFGKNYHPRLRKENGISKVMFSASVSFFFYNNTLDFGYAIDCSNSIISGSYVSAGPEFTYTSPSKNGQPGSTSTERASGINLEYTMSGTSLVPQISVTNDLGKRNFFWRLSAGWMIPVWYTGVIDVDQRSSAGHVNELEDITVFKISPIEQYINSNITNRSFNLSGLTVGAFIGFRIRSAPKKT